MLLDHHVDGIVFVSGLHADTTASRERYHRLRARGLPLVLVNGYAEGVDASFVSTDDAAAMGLAVRHLVSLGHRRIGLAIGPDRFVPARRKVDAFTRALHDQLPDEADAAHVVTTLFPVEGGQAATTELVATGHTAIVCGSDLMALGAIRAIRSLGLSVPGDVSVVGFDDSPLIGFTDPALTTVRQPVRAMAEAAVETLIGEIAGNPGPRTELLFHPELVMRGSTSSAPPVP